MTFPAACKNAASNCRPERTGGGKNERAEHTCKRNVPFVARDRVGRIGRNAGWLRTTKEIGTQTTKFHTPKMRSVTAGPKRESNNCVTGDRTRPPAPDPA